MATLPHFLIVGAPKCGTTSLYYYLQQNPLVFMPQNKEPRFFCDYPVETFEFGTKQFHPNIVSAPHEYLRLFEDARDGQLCGEASTDYLSTPGTAARIHAWNAETKIIILLRDPIMRAYSEYQHSIAAAFQSDSFWQSILSEPRRTQEQYDPIFRHVGRGRYYEPVKSFLDTFGKRNVKVIIFDKLAKSTNCIVDETFDFLGLPRIPVDVSKRYNTSTFIPFVPNILLPVLRRVLERLPVKEFVRKAPTGRPSARVTLTPSQYEEFRLQFIGDIERLSALIDEDLSHWLPKDT